MMRKFLMQDDAGYPHVSNAVLLTFCGYVVIWYLQIGYRFPALGAIRIEFIWALVLISLAIISPNKLELMDNPLGGIVVLFLISIAIQVPFSYVPEHSWDVFFNRVLKFSFMAFFIVSFVKSPKHLMFFIAAFMLACMKMGQEGFVGHLTGNMLWENQGVMRLHGSTPNYMHPNSFAGMAIGTIPFIIYLYPIVPRFIKVILLVQLVFACNIILYSGSRTAYVALAVLMLFIVIKSQKKIITFVSIVFVLIIFMQYVDHQYVERFSTIFTGVEIEGNSIGARKQILKDAIEVFIEHPFGIGVGAFPAMRTEIFGRTQDTHNLYLEIATNIGIQGLVIFCFFIMKMLKILNSIQCKSKKYIEHINTIKNNVIENVTHKNEYEIINNIKFLEAISKAVYLFIILRLTLGLFGMDLYEVYWWFSSGLVFSLYNINKHMSSFLKSEYVIEVD